MKRKTPFIQSAISLTDKAAGDAQLDGRGFFIVLLLFCQQILTGFQCPGGNVFGIICGLRYTVNHKYWLIF